MGSGVEQALFEWSGQGAWLNSPSQCGTMMSCYILRIECNVMCALSTWYVVTCAHMLVFRYSIYIQEFYFFLLFVCSLFSFLWTISTCRVLANLATTMCCTMTITFQQMACRHFPISCATSAFAVPAVRPIQPQPTMPTWLPSEHVISCQPLKIRGT